MKIFYVFTRSAICLQMPLPFDVILVNFSSIVLFSMLLQTCNNSFYCFCLFVYYFGPEVAKSIKIGFYMKGLSMWCPKMIKNHVLGISLLMVSLDFWSEKFDPPYYVHDFPWINNILCFYFQEIHFNRIFSRNKWIWVNDN